MTNTVRKLGYATTLFAFLLGLSNLTEAAPAKKGWVAVITDSRDKTWYVDSGSIQGKGRFRYFWSYTTGGSPYPENGKLAYSTAYYLSVDCQQKLYRLRFAKSLDENLKVLQEYNFGETLPLGKPASGSGEAASMNYVCSRR